MCSNKRKWVDAYVNVRMPFVKWLTTSASPSSDIPTLKVYLLKSRVPWLQILANRLKSGTAVWTLLAFMKLWYRKRKFVDSFMRLDRKVVNFPRTDNVSLRFRVDRATNPYISQIQLHRCDYNRISIIPRLLSKCATIRIFHYPNAALFQLHISFTAMIWNYYCALLPKEKRIVLAVDTKRGTKLE